MKEKEPVGENLSESFSENATDGDELAWEGEHSPVAPGHPAAGGPPTKVLSWKRQAYLKPSWALRH